MVAVSTTDAIKYGFRLLAYLAAVNIIAGVIGLVGFGIVGSSAGGPFESPDTGAMLFGLLISLVAYLIWIAGHLGVGYKVIADAVDAGTDGLTGSPSTASSGPQPGGGRGPQQGQSRGAQQSAPSAQQPPQGRSGGQPAGTRQANPGPAQGGAQQTNPDQGTADANQQSAEADQQPSESADRSDEGRERRRRGSGSRSRRSDRRDERR